MLVLFVVLLLLPSTALGPSSTAVDFHPKSQTRLLKTGKCHRALSSGLTGFSLQVWKDFPERDRLPYRT